MIYIPYRSLIEALYTLNYSPVVPIMTRGRNRGIWCHTTRGSAAASVEGSRAVGV